MLMLVFLWEISRAVNMKSIRLKWTNLWPFRAYRVEKNTLEIAEDKSVQRFLHMAFWSSIIRQASALTCSFVKPVDSFLTGCKFSIHFHFFLSGGLLCLLLHVWDHMWLAPKVILAQQLMMEPMTAALFPVASPELALQVGISCDACFSQRRHILLSCRLYRAVQNIAGTYGICHEHNLGNASCEACPQGKYMPSETRSDWFHGHVSNRCFDHIIHCDSNKSEATSDIWLFLLLFLLRVLILLILGLLRTQISIFLCLIRFADEAILHKANASSDTVCNCDKEKGFVNEALLDINSTVLRNILRHGHAEFKNIICVRRSCPEGFSLQENGLLCFSFSSFALSASIPVFAHPPHLTVASNIFFAGQCVSMASVRTLYETAVQLHRATEENVRAILRWFSNKKKVTPWMEKNRDSC